MKRIFADSFYFIALLRENDLAHGRALQFSRSQNASLVTTHWVLAEVADALSDPAYRIKAGVFVDFALSASRFVFAQDSEALLKRGLQLYRQRADKDWSLTDCTSFVVMREQRITEALTADHHFEQAGFVALLK